MEKKSKTIIEMLARKQNCSVQEIREQIAARIKVGLNDPDPASREQWEQIPCAGEIPTPEEFVGYVIKKLEADGLDHLLRWYPNL